MTSTFRTARAICAETSQDPELSPELRKEARKLMNKLIRLPSGSPMATAGGLKEMAQKKEITKKSEAEKKEEKTK